MADRLDQPRPRRKRISLPRFDPEAFGGFAEKFARFMGTPQFIVYMTIFVILWIAINLVGLLGLHWDPYPFILLNLFFSTQASYAAPLILLAQNRQADRDRVSLDADRRRAQAQKADTEYLAREIAGLRLALGELATRDFIRSELSKLAEELDDAAARRHAGSGAQSGGAKGGSATSSAAQGSGAKSARTARRKGHDARLSSS